MTKIVENCELAGCCELRRDSAIACEDCVIKYTRCSHKKGAEKNALAELALKANLLMLDRTSYSSYESFINACETKNKVVLILNELSNVKFEGIVSKDGNGIVSPSVTMRPKIDSLIDKFYNAINIAEQGERDGK